MKNNLKKYVPAATREVLSGGSNKSPRLSALIIIVLAAVFSAQPVLAAKHAAKVIYSFGDVSAESKSGARGLKRGDMVYSGETVSTERGRAQIKFTDGGFASLQPNTDYEINEYKFEGKADGEERSFLNLLKGSVRLVTGVIGKANRKNFRIRTAVATIGIRGTQGTLSHDPETNVTTLKGHGGEWDLESGSFFGPVPAGQSFSCNGVSCARVVGTKTRAEVGRGEGKKSQQRKEPAYQQGQQSDPEGRNCDFDGGCGEKLTAKSGEKLTAKINQHGAVAKSKTNGDEITGSVNFLERLAVAAVDAKPAALISNSKVSGDRTIRLVTNNATAATFLLNSDAEGSDTGDSFIDDAKTFVGELDADLIAELATNPATVQEEDFGVTPDGLITFGRWANGNLLVAGKNLESGSIEQRIETLSNFRSFHFIFGDLLDSISFTGTGIYSLTGATRPTAVDGSAIGLAPTTGMLTWNFGVGFGDINLPVSFNNTLFTISGALQPVAAGNWVDPTVGSIFMGNSLMATFPSTGETSGSATVDLYGFFAGPNGINAPRAAGVSYLVNYGSMPFEGVAGFGFTGVSAFMPTTTIKYSLSYFDSSGMTLGSLANGDNQLAMGTPLSGFTTSFGDTFNQSDAIEAESGSNATFGVSWARFTGGTYAFTSGALPTTPILSGPFHAISTSYTTPSAVIANTTGTAMYTLADSTSPTLIFDIIVPGLFFRSQGTLASATFSANFTTGMMDSVVYSGAFPVEPGTTFDLASTGAVAINSGSSPLVGTYNAASAFCSPGCALNGVSKYEFASTNVGGPPGALISSFQVSGSNIIGGITITGAALSTGAITPP